MDRGSHVGLPLYARWNEDADADPSLGRPEAMLSVSVISTTTLAGDPSALSLCHLSANGLFRPSDDGQLPDSCVDGYLSFSGTKRVFNYQSLGGEIPASSVLPNAFPRCCTSCVVIRAFSSRGHDPSCFEQRGLDTRAVGNCRNRRTSSLANSIRWFPSRPPHAQGSADPVSSQSFAENSPV